MQEPNRSQAEAVNPLIKLIKEREDLYFQMLAFVNSNLQSSSNDLDNTTIFNKFITIIDQKHAKASKKQELFIDSFSNLFAEADEGQDDPVSKEMLRLSSRLIEILEASIARVRKSVFDDSGRAIKQFNRFKSTLNKILKRDCFVVKDFVEHIISYCTSKYKKQFFKLQKYVQKVKQGENIWFRQLYCKEKSDVQVSPDQHKPKEEEKTARKFVKKIDMTEHLSSTQQPEKKAMSIKKTVKPSTTKRRERLLNVKKSKEECDEPLHLNQQQTANKLYKFYMLLELNKKQFLEDYRYEKIEEEKHKTELLCKLMERNKQINSQINGYVLKSTHHLPVPLIFPPSKSSGDERNQSLSSKVSLRTSFIISKRKASFHIESGSEKHSDKEIKKQQEPFSKTIKNINPRRRSSHSNTRNPQKSKKLFVVKAPMVFEEQIIPQAQITQTQWLQAPLTVKCRQKKTDSIRLKRKNNVNPMENAFLPQNFRYPF